HGAIINIAADFHPKSADQSGILREIKGQSRPINTGQVLLYRGLIVRSERDCAFDFRGMAFDVELHKPLEVRQNSKIASRLLLEQLLDDLARPGFVQYAGLRCQPEKLLRVAPCLFGDLHATFTLGPLPADSLRR